MEEVKDEQSASEIQLSAGRDRMRTCAKTVAA